LSDVLFFLSPDERGALLFPQTSSRENSLHFLEQQARRTLTRPLSIPSFPSSFPPPPQLSPLTQFLPTLTFLSSHNPPPPPSPSPYLSPTHPPLRFDLFPLPLFSFSSHYPLACALPPPLSLSSSTLSPLSPLSLLLPLFSLSRGAPVVVSDSTAANPLAFSFVLQTLAGS